MDCVGLIYSDRKSTGRCDSAVFGDVPRICNTSILWYVSPLCFKTGLHDPF